MYLAMAHSLDNPSVTSALNNSLPNIGKKNHYWFVMQLPEIAQILEPKTLELALEDNVTARLIKQKIVILERMDSEIFSTT